MLFYYAFAEKVFMMLGKVEFELQKLLDHYVSGSRNFLIIKCMLIELSYSSLSLYVSSALIYPWQLPSHQSRFLLNFRLFRYAMLIILTLSSMLFSWSLLVLLFLLVSELFLTSAELLSCVDFWFWLLAYTMWIYLKWAMVLNIWSILFTIALPTFIWSWRLQSSPDSKGTRFTPTSSGSWCN